MRGKFSSPTLKLNNLERVWEDAIRASSGSCIIAEAIQQQYPHLSSVSVDMATIRVSDKKKGLRYTYLTPDAAQMLLLSFDQGWAMPDEFKQVTIRTAVKTTKIVATKARAGARLRRRQELEEKERDGTLTSDEKRALARSRKVPARPTQLGKAEIAQDPSNRTVHGGKAPKQGPAHPNLLRGRNRQFGKKIAQPAVLFESAVQKAVDDRLAAEMGEVKDGWVIVPSWNKFQHYHDRNPTWIKLYLELQHREEWNQLTLAARGLLVSIWMEYASSGGVIKASEVSRDVRATTRRSTFDSLLSAGFITLSASKPLEQRREEKKENKQRKTAKPVDNSEKTKRKVKAWLANTATELEGVDLAYVLADEFKIEDQDLLADLIAYAQENYLLKRRD